MKQMIKSHGIIVLVIALCIAFSWFSSNLLYCHSLTNVDQIMYYDGCLGGVDVLEQSYIVFQVDLRTGESRYLEVPKIRNEKSFTLSQLNVLKAGEIWLICSYTWEDGAHTDLVRCDFDLGELETVVHLENVPDKSFFAFACAAEMPQVFLYNKDNVVERYQVENNELIYLDTPLAEYNTKSQIFSITDDGAVYDIYEDGWINRQDEQGKPDPVMKMEGSREEGWNYDYQFYQDDIYYKNSKDGQWMNIDLTKKPYLAVPCEPTCSPAESFDETRLVGNYFDHGKVKCGKLFLEDGRRVPAVCGTYDQVIERLSQDEFLVMFRVVASLLYIFTFLLIRTIWRALKKRHVVIPLVAYAAAFTLLFMAIGVNYTQALISLVLHESMEKNNYGTCIQLGFASMNRFLVDNIQTMCAYPEITRENALPYSYDFSAYDRLTLYDVSRSQSVSSPNGIDFRLYFQKDGEIYPMPGSFYIANTPLPYNMINCDLDALDAMQKAFKEKKVVTQQYEDLDGREFSAFIPFKNSGEYPLLLEVAMSQSESNRRIAQQQVAIQNLLVRMAFMLTAAILLVIWISMKPLRSLKEAALGITRGELGMRAYARGRSEAAVTAVYFNRMADQIADQVSGSSAYQKKYEAFAPLWLLDGENTFGVKREKCSIMAVKLHQDDQDSKRILGEIHGNHGEALSFEDEETWCLFPESAEDALQAALGIIKPFREKSEVLASIGLDDDEIYLGIVGNTTRRALETFNPGGDRLRFLRSCAEKYKTPVLITQAALCSIPDSKKRFHLRLLGRFWFSASGKAEEIYEVLDGECTEQYRKKQLTDESFQQGRKAFEANDYLTARAAFVNVLTKNQQDKAALHYICLCDNALNDALNNENALHDVPKDKDSLHHLPDKKGFMEVY